MKLRRLLTPVAPVVLAALALSPLAVTTSATAGGIPTNHNQTFNDTDENAVTTNAVNIVSTHVLRTANDFRAIVKYKDLTALKSTRWEIAFVSFDGSGPSDDVTSGPDDESSPGPSSVSGNYVDFRLSPTGKTSTVAYYIGNEQFTKATCQSISAQPNTTANTITFTIPNGCWKSKNSPDLVITGAKHTSAANYAKAEPGDSFGDESKYSDYSENSDSCGWDWGGPNVGCGGPLKNGRAYAQRLHL